MATNSTRKMTKVEMFAQIKAHLTDEAEIQFIDHEIELLSKKNGADRKPTAHQMENEKYKKAIVAFLTSHPGNFTISQLTKQVPELSADEAMTPQRVNAMVRQLLGVTVKREEIKGTAYFSAM